MKDHAREKWSTTNNVEYLTNSIRYIKSCLRFESLNKLDAPLLPLTVGGSEGRELLQDYVLAFHKCIS